MEYRKIENPEYEKYIDDVIVFAPADFRVGMAIAKFIADAFPYTCTGNGRGEYCYTVHNDFLSWDMGKHDMMERLAKAISYTIQRGVYTRIGGQCYRTMCDRTNWDSCVESVEEIPEPISPRIPNMKGPVKSGWMGATRVSLNSYLIKNKEKALLASMKTWLEKLSKPKDKEKKTLVKRILDKYGISYTENKVSRGWF